MDKDKIKDALDKWCVQYYGSRWKCPKNTGYQRRTVECWQCHENDGRAQAVADALELK